MQICYEDRLGYKTDLSILIQKIIFLGLAGFWDFESIFITRFNNTV